MENSFSDTYKTIEKPSEEILFKDRKSKFYAYVFPIVDEDEVKPLIDAIRKKHHTANHACYAWRLGIDKQRYRTNDDGEPNNSAGMPIYGQIQSFDLTNVLVVVARIFGGTKLGVGGLIGAYRTAAQMALETSKIIEKKLQQQFLISFEYQDMDKVMRVIKNQGIDIISKNLQTRCSYVIGVRKQHANQIEHIFSAMPQINIRIKD